MKIYMVSLLHMATINKQLQVKHVLLLLIQLGAWY